MNHGVIIQLSMFYNYNYIANKSVKQFVGEQKQKYFCLLLNLVNYILILNKHRDSGLIKYKT